MDRHCKLLWLHNSVSRDLQLVGSHYENAILHLQTPPAVLGLWTCAASGFPDANTAAPPRRAHRCTRMSNACGCVFFLVPPDTYFEFDLIKRMNTLGVSFLICSTKQFTECRERERERERKREREREKAFSLQVFFSVVFINCFLCSSRSVFNLMSSKIRKEAICYFSIHVPFYSLLPLLFTCFSFISCGPL